MRKYKIYSSRFIFLSKLNFYKINKKKDCNGDWGLGIGDWG